MEENFGPKWKTRTLFISIAVYCEYIKAGLAIKCLIKENFGPKWKTRTLFTSIAVSCEYIKAGLGIKV